MGQDECSGDIPEAGAPEHASRDGAGPASPMRRVLAGSIAAVFASAWGVALAQPVAGRMSSDERERLRRELRQQPGRGRRDDERANSQRERTSPQQRERMSPQQREQLRRQLREAHASERPSGRRRD